jgi:general secretion pathway protein B
MSFILDALRKSENERQQNQPAEFSQVPVSHDSTPAPRWLWVLGVLLVINILVVAALMFGNNRDLPPAHVTQPVAAAVVPAAATSAADDTTTTGAGSFADQLDIARQNQSQRRPAEADTPQREPDVTLSTVNPAPTQTTSPAASGATTAEASLPGFDEVRLNGSVSLPELHIDLHVYNEQANRRFVSINMQKYKENDTLASGPVVRKITSDGVVLEYQGVRFVLRK